MRKIALLLLLFGCKEVGPPADLAMEPAWALDDRETPVVIRGSFLFARVKVDYTSSATVTARMKVALSGRPLNVRLRAPGEMSAVVGRGWPVGYYDLEVTDPEGRTNTVVEAFRVCHTVCDPEPDGGVRPEDSGVTEPQDGGVKPGTPPLEQERRGCNGTCSAADDCDGLPTARDPEPAICNELIYEEVFQADPGSDWSHFNGRWAHHTNWMSWELASSSGAYTLIRSAEADPLPTADYLVEARIRLGSALNQHWETSILSRYDHDYPHFMACGIWREGVEHPEIFMQLRRDSRGWTGDPATSGWSSASPHPSRTDYEDPNFSTSNGATYLLQLYYTQNPLEEAICRLVSDDGEVIRNARFEIFREPGYSVLVPSAPSSVGVRTIDRAAYVDYLRVFELHEVD